MQNTLILHNKTEAISTIRGFHFQYLKTLKSWLDCYANIEEEIYCEVEDDLIQKNSITNFVRFTQIKSYSSEFRLSSDSLKKTIVNFFNIFNRYDSAKNEIEFLFYSNSSPVKETLLEKWFISQNNISESLFTEICSEVYKILQEKINNETLINGGFTSNSKGFISFVKKIKWVFEGKNTDESINELTILIKNLIRNIPDSPIIEGYEDLIFSKLYFEVVQTSHNKESQSRKLTHQNLIDIIANEDDSWYVEAKKEWIENNPIYFSFGEFSSIKQGAIHAHYTKYLKNDVPFWIEKLDYFITNCIKNTISKRQAIYEVIVISLRNLKNLDGRGEYILSYFEDFTNYIDETQLQEATILLSLLRTAKAFENFEIPIENEKINEWIKLLDTVLIEEIKMAKKPNRLSNLSETKGHFTFFFSNNGRTNELNDLQERIDNSNFWYEKAISNLSNAPLFPIRKFIFEQNKKLEKIVQIKELNLTKLEEIISQAEDIYNQNRYKDLSSKKQRAFSYVENGENLKALKILHRIKDELFNYEKLEECLQIRLLISGIYLELGLAYASKYYGLATCDTIMENGGYDGSLQKLFPKAIYQTAKADYNQGQWISFLFFVRAFFLSKQISIANQSIKVDNYEVRLYDKLFKISLLNKRFKFISQDKLRKMFPLDDFSKDEIDLCEKTLDEKLKGFTNKILWQQLEEQMIDTPFCDYSKTRTISWRAYGINWIATYENEYHLVSSAEQFLAFFQIVLAEINEVDLCFPSTEVKLILAKNTIDNKITIKDKSSNEKRIWEIQLPIINFLNKIQHEEYFKELERSLLHISMTILIELSPLKDDILLDKLKGELIEKTHLSNKVAISKPYEILNKIFVIEKYFNELYSSPKRNLPYPFASKLETILPKRQELGLTYNKSYNLEQIDNRYKRVIPLIRFTLKRLIKDVKFQGIVNVLKSEGYLDWQILACTANIKVNYYNHQLWKKGFSHQECIEGAKKLMECKEMSYEDSSTPLSEFTILAFRKAMNMYIISTLQSYNLIFRSNYPLIKPIENLLIDRYNFKIDDVEHPNYWNSEGLDIG